MSYLDRIHTAQRNTINMLRWLQDMNEMPQPDLQGLMDVISEAEYIAKDLQNMFDELNKQRTPVPSLDELKEEIDKVKGGK